MSQSADTKGKGCVGFGLVALCLVPLGFVVVLCVGGGGLGGRGGGQSTFAGKSTEVYFGRETEAKLDAFREGATTSNPRVREATLRDRKKVEEAFSMVPYFDSGQPQLKKYVYDIIRDRLKDDDPLVRLAAAELVADAKTEWKLNREDAAAVFEGLLTHADSQARLGAATWLWQRNASAPAGKVLVEIVADKKAPVADRLKAAETKTAGTPPRRADGVAKTLAAALADPDEPDAIRTLAVQVVTREADPKTSLTDDVRGQLMAVVTDSKRTAELRAGLLGLVARQPDGTLPDEVRRLLVTYAAEEDTPVPLRVRAFGLLQPGSPQFAKDHPELAKRLERAVTDPKDVMAFRAFAAHFYTPETAERLAAAVAVLSVTTDATKTLRRVLAQRVATTYPGNKLPPKGWGTPELAKRMAVTPSAYRTPQVESGYSDTGEPWQVVKEGELPAANFDALVIHYLVHFWADVLPHLLIDDRDYTTYSLFYARAGQVLGRVKVDQAPALHKALVQVMRDTTLSEPVRIEAANRLFRGEWPNGLATSWSDRLAAVDTTHEERVIIVQWSVVEKAYHTPLGWYLNLLKGQRGEARCAVAEVIGKMGPEAKDAIPELIMGLKADTIAPAPYVSALAAIGPDSVPALGELMKEKEPKLRTAAAEALGLIGPEGRSKATPILRTAIEQEKDDAVKKAALEALGQVNPVEAKKLGWTAK